MIAMPLQNFVDFNPPTVTAAWLNNVDQAVNVWLGSASNPVATPIAPIGNPIATNSVLAISATTAALTTREFALQVGLNANTGALQSNNGSGDKVAIYAGIVGLAGGGNIWAFNPLCQINSGWTGETGGAVQTALCAEFDLNNDNVDYGNSTGTAFGNPAAIGISITGAGSNFCTSAIQVVGNRTGGNPMWRFGAWFGNNSVQNATIVDTTNSVSSIVIDGIHTYGIDYSRSTCTSAERFGNVQTVAWRNGANSADLTVFQMSSGNVFTLGAGATSTAVGSNFQLTVAAVSTAGALNLGNGTQTTVGATGAASALPANPLGYLVGFNGTTKIAIPFYNG